MKKEWLTKEIATAPNVITTIRLIGSGVLMGHMLKNGVTHPLLLGILYGSIVGTDFVDGYVARKYNQVSDFGKIYDPIVDKIATWGPGLLLMFSQNIIPKEYLLIGLRDVYVAILSGLYKKENKHTLLPTNLGKLKMFLLAGGITSSLFMGWNNLSQALMMSATGVALADMALVTSLYKESKKIKKEEISTEKARLQKLKDLLVGYKLSDLGNEETNSKDKQVKVKTKNRSK